MDWTPSKRNHSENSKKNRKSSNSFFSHSSSSESPSHNSEESIHSTENYHYVKKIIKYSKDSETNSDSSMNVFSFSKNRFPSKSFKHPKPQKPFPKFQNPPKKPQKAQKKPRKQPKTDPEKDEIISKILQRWWYALEDWPPSNINYSALLKKQKFRLVPVEQYSIEPLPNDFFKAKNVPGYPGVFITPQGLKDMRPQSTCPCYDNLVQKPLQELKEILAKALNNQLSQAQALPDNNLLVLELLAEIRAVNKL